MPNIFQPIYAPPPIPPALISNEIAGLTGNTGAISANTVYLYTFELQNGTLIVSVACRLSATATGTTNIGIYSYNGSLAAGANLVAGSDTGAKTNVANSTLLTTYASPIILGPGIYFLALSNNNGTDTYQTLSPNSTDLSRAKRATNVLAAGALPLTTGVIVSNVANAPGMCAHPFGGI